MFYAFLKFTIHDHRMFYAAMCLLWIHILMPINQALEKLVGFR